MLYAKELTNGTAQRVVPFMSVNMTIFDVKIDEIIPYENNPRVNDRAVEYVANSIREFGFKVPIIIDKHNTIIAGHTRVKAAKSLGMEEVPCLIADDLTDEQVKAFRLIDNKAAEFSTWDYPLLELELESLVDFNMEQFGFLDVSIDDIEERLDELMDTEAAQEKEPKEPKTIVCPYCGKEFEI